jgi:hypothetical protein
MELSYLHSFNQLLNKDETNSKSSKRGWIKDVSVENVINILRLENKTYLLEVKDNNVLNYIWLVDGEIFSADVPGKLKKADSLYHMLSSKKVDMSFWEINFKDKIKKDIDIPILNLVLKSIKKKDEQNLDTKDKIHSKDEQRSNALMEDEAIQALQEDLSPKNDQDNIQSYIENVLAKLKRYNEQARKFGKIVDSMITDASGNIIITSNNSNEISVDLKLLITTVLETVKISVPIYNLRSDDYISLLDSKSSMLISPIDTSQFLIVIFEN